MSENRTEQGGASPRRFKPYPAYKDSGVEWLGEIPAHWRVTKMWDVAQATSGGTPAKETLRYWDGGIPWVSPKDMKRRFIDSSEDTVSATAVSETGLKLVPQPAVLVVVRGMILAHSFPVGITKVPVTINQDMKALRLRDDVNPEFFGYWLEGMGRDLLAVLVDEAAHGTKAIRMDTWRLTPVEIPPEDEQRAIAAFLDRETAKIDALVAKKERVIELLQEKRTALITRAVAKGLDPTVPMKDSGVEWLGEIPAHWDVAPVYSRYSIELGKMLDAKRVTREHLAPYVRNVDVQWDRVNVRSLPEMDFEPIERQRYSLRPGDLLVCEGGEVGRTAIWRGDLEECFYQKAIHRVRPASSRDEPRFFYYMMYSAAKRGAFVAGGNPNTIDHLTAIQLRHYRFPFPPRIEQEQIAKVLDMESTKIDDLVRAIEDGIDRLKEFRSALISAAVTGKIDVREGTA